MTKKRASPTKGDHLYVRRMGYEHHGIYDGQGGVIHYTGTPTSKKYACIKKTPLQEFAAGSPIKTRHHANPSFSPDEVVRRALSRLGEAEYDLTGNNCEHLASWCITGRHASHQVDRAIPATAAVTATALGGVGLQTVAAAGTVTSTLSGPSIMAGLAAIGPGGPVGGGVTLAGASAVGTTMLLKSTVLADDSSLDADERSARRAGRVASYATTATATATSVAAISALGTTAGLSGAGIMSGLATIGGMVGGGAAAGVGVVAAGPAVATFAAGYGIYKLWQLAN